jgi:hypothetical protein
MTPAETTLTRPVAPPAPGWSALGTWFEAPTPHGPLQLYLGESDGPARHASGAALALHRAAPVLKLLDYWLAEAAPHWRWREAPTPRLCATTVRLPWLHTCHQLIAPWPWLRAQPAPPDTLTDRIQWPAMHAVLTIDRLRLSADELQQLEPGGAVLLPESMRPGWTGQLRATTELDERNEGPADAGLAVALDDPARPRVLPGEPPPLQAIGPGGQPCEVRLHLQHTLPADRLTGWRPDSLQEAITPGLAASLWQTAAAREPVRCLAHGRLLPWGDGWALLIDGLGEEPEQAHVSPA